MNDDLKVSQGELLEAEKAVLGALLYHYDYLNNEIDVSQIEAGIFVTSDGREIFNAIGISSLDGHEIDKIIVGSYLKSTISDQNVLNRTFKYLYSLEKNASFVRVSEYLEILRNNHIKEELNQLSNKILKIKPGIKGFDNLIESWRESFLDIIARKEYKDYLHIEEVIRAYDALIAQSQEKGDLKKRFLKTKYKILDDKIRGLIGGQLLILAARPGVGKTTFALNILCNNLSRIKVNEFDVNGKQAAIGFFSLEMTKESLLEKILAIESKISLNDVKKPLEGKELPSYEKKMLDNTKRILAKSNILFCDTSNVTIAKIAGMVKMWARKYDLKLVIIDYLQLINLPNSKEMAGFSQHQRIGVISRTLKLICNDLNIPIIALAQLNRKAEERKLDNQEPVLSDLRESGSIEQDADIVLFLYQDNKKVLDAVDGVELDNKKNFLTPEITLKIGKNRHGEQGDVRFVFNKVLGTFEMIQANFYDNN